MCASRRPVLFDKALKADNKRHNVWHSIVEQLSGWLSDLLFGRSGVDGKMRLLRALDATQL